MVLAQGSQSAAPGPSRHAPPIGRASTVAGTPMSSASESARRMLQSQQSGSSAMSGIPRSTSASTSLPLTQQSTSRPPINQSTLARQSGSGSTVPPPLSSRPPPPRTPTHASGSRIPVYHSPPKTPSTHPSTPKRSRHEHQVN